MRAAAVIGGGMQRLRRLLVEHGAAYLVIWLLALATQLPLMTDYQRLVLTRPDGTIHPDTLNYLYAQHRFALQLVDGANPLRDPTQNAPEGLDLIYLDPPWLMLLLLAPVSAYLRPELAGNLLVLAAHGMTGMLVYHWARLLGLRGRLAPLFAALAAVLLPWRLAHAASHPNLVSTQFVVGWFVVLELWRQRRVTGARLTVLVGVSALLLTAGSFQLAFVALTVTPLVLIGPIRQFWRTRARQVSADDRSAGLAALLGGLIGALPLLTAQPVFLRSFSADAVAKYSADRWSWVRSAPQSWPGGWLPWPALTSEEQVLTLGFVLSGLALLGLWRARTAAMRGPLLMAAAAALLAFGPALGGIPFPAALAGLVGFDAFRAWARFGLITGLVGAVIAAAGLAWLLQRLVTRRARLAAYAIAVLLLLVEVFPVRQTAAPIVADALSARIAALPADSVTLLVPNVASDSFAETLYALRFGLVRTYSNQHLVSYAHSAHWPLQYAAFEREMRRLTEPATPTVLCRMGVTHLLISERYWQRTPQPAQAGLTTIGAVTADWRLTALPPCPAPDGVQP